MAFLGAIGGFLRGLGLGLAVIAAAIAAVAFFSADEDPARTDVAGKQPAPGKGAAGAGKSNEATRIAAAPQAPAGGGAFTSPSMTTPGMTAPGGADDLGALGGRGAGAPVSRLNTDALASLDRADPSGFAGAQSSAPRPSAIGAGAAPQAALQQFDPTGDAPAAAAGESGLARPTPSRLAALQHGGGLGGGHALTVIANIPLPEARRVPGADAQIGAPGATQGLGAPNLAGPAIPGGPAMAGGPALPGGDRMAALPSTLGGPSPMGAPGVPGGALTSPSAPGMASPGMRAPGLPAPGMASPGMSAPGRPNIGGGGMAAPGRPGIGGPGMAPPASRLTGPSLESVTPMPMPGIGGPAPSAPEMAEEDTPEAIFVPGVGIVVPDAPAEDSPATAEAAPTEGGVFFRAPESTSSPAPSLSAAPGLALAGPSIPSGPAFSAPSLGGRAPSLPGIGRAVDPMASAPVAPAAGLRGPSLDTSTASVAPIRSLGAAPTPGGYAPATVDAGDDAEESVADVRDRGLSDGERDMRAAVLRDTGGVPLPVARPSQKTETPVRRVDVAAVPVLRKGSVPVRRTGDISQGGTRTAGNVPVTPVTRLNRGDQGGPNATAPVVLGPGRLDDRRASSLVAAISTRPGSRVTRPNVYAAPGLQAEERQGGFAGAQSSAPRPTFGGPAPALGGAAPSFGDASAPGAFGGRNEGRVVRFGNAGLGQQPRMAALPSIRGSAPSMPGRSAAPSLPQVMSDVAPTAPAAALAPAAAPQGPMVALVLHGLDPALAADPQGVLAPLFAVRAPVSLVAPLGYAPDAATVEALRRNGVELVLQAANRAEVRASARAGAVAVQPIDDGSSPMTMTSMRRFLKEAKDQGLAVFSPASGIGGAANLARNSGVSLVQSLQYVEIRSAANLRVLHASLDQAAFQARNSGHGAAIELMASPEAVQAAAEWFAANHAGAAVPVAISALQPR